jgi:hypothetical protein
MTSVIYSLAAFSIAVHEDVIWNEALLLNFREYPRRSAVSSMCDRHTGGSINSGRNPMWPREFVSLGVGAANYPDLQISAGAIAQNVTTVHQRPTLRWYRLSCGVVRIRAEN